MRFCFKFILYGSLILSNWWSLTIRLYLRWALRLRCSLLRLKNWLPMHLHWRPRGAIANASEIMVLRKNSWLVKLRWLWMMSSWRVIYACRELWSRRCIFWWHPNPSQYYQLRWLSSSSWLWGRTWPPSVKAVFLHKMYYHIRSTGLFLYSLGTEINRAPSRQ